MPKDDRESNANAGIGAGYAAFQLSRALAAPGLDNNGQTSKRIERWRNVIEHILQGSASYGSRTPFADVPEWVTLEVVTGGFATGQFLAGGALTEYERQLAVAASPGFDGRGMLQMDMHAPADEVEVLSLQPGDDQKYGVRVAADGVLSSDAR
ncbi:hypothetical protein [Pseudomonas sp. CFBP13508]|uniref:hypothetical protein n=1 Tax=Pseudomonas sp. CFBP13508 TaxID=2184009 RepID=UPI0010BFC0BF|nr:hypothetical protein [Pseudomonas sp. CFBP13508]